MGMAGRQGPVFPAVERYSYPNCSWQCPRPNSQTASESVIAAAEVPAHEPLEQEDVSAEDKPLSFSHVAVGGTFDRLHVGHRLLLAATALICTEKVYIGVTGIHLTLSCPA